MRISYGITICDEAEELHNLLSHLQSLIDDNDEVIDIIDYLDNNNIDINFHNAKTGDFYNRYRHIERTVQMSKMLKGSKTEVQQMIEKVDSITVKERPDWLEMYRNDTTDEKIEESKMNFSSENPFQRITDMLTQRVRDDIENEPGITLDEIREQMNNEINNN